MDRLVLVVLLGLASCSHGSSVLEVTVRPGDDITLYCDCKPSLGVYIIWYRNCSHENQPPLVLEFNTIYQQINRFPRFEIQRNVSSDSYDLLIRNVRSTDEGLYYCQNKERTVEKSKLKEMYIDGNISTSLTVKSRRSDPDSKQNLQNCDGYRKLLFSLLPAVCVLITFVLSFLINLLCQKTENQDGEKRHGTKRQTGETQGFAALEILQASQRPEEKRTLQSSDFNTYSIVRYDLNVMHLNVLQRYDQI